MFLHNSKVKTKTTMQLTIIILSILLVHRTASGMHFSFERDSDDSSASLVSQSVEKALSVNESSEIDGASTNETGENSPMFTDANDENNSTLAGGNRSLSSTYSSSSVPSTSVIQNRETWTAVSSNESQSLSSTQSSSNGSSSATKSTVLTTSAGNETNATSSTSSEDDEPEGVARGKPSSTESVGTTTTKPQTLYEKTWALISDAYTLSILVPVAAGVVFATTVILTLATCRCLRRRCMRRRLRRKPLPDSVKNLRPSDRARLLAESSDEEF